MKRFVPLAGVKLSLTCLAAFVLSLTSACEFGLPGIRDFPDVEIPFFLAEEHCVINQCPDWQVGQLLHFIPTHACTTCNLHREILVYENDIVVEVWPIEASGKLT